MTSIRDERAAALIRRHRDLSDDFTRALPGLLDDLEAIDRAQVPTGVIEFDLPQSGSTLTDKEAAEFAEKWLAANPALGVSVKPEAVAAALAEPPAPTDAQIAAWIDANPAKFEAWVRKQNRINGAPPPFDAPAKPATRRRTTR